MIGSAQYLVDPVPAQAVIRNSTLTFPAGGGNSGYNVTAIWVELTSDAGDSVRRTISILNGGIGARNVVARILVDVTRNFGYLARIYGTEIQ